MTKISRRLFLVASPVMALFRKSAAKPIPPAIDLSALQPTGVEYAVSPRPYRDRIDYINPKLWGKI